MSRMVWVGSLRRCFSKKNKRVGPRSTDDPSRSALRCASQAGVGVAVPDVRARFRIPMGGNGPEPGWRACRGERVVASVSWRAIRYRRVELGCVSRSVAVQP